MSVLRMTNPDELANTLQGLTPAQVRRRAEEVKALLNHRSHIVRWAAAESLGRARMGASELRERLEKERNSIVLTEIAGSLVSLRDRQSVPRLRFLAEKHSAPLVRNYASLAIADILGKEALPYLRERLAEERNRRAKAALRCALFAKGDTQVLPELLKSLRSTDDLIRGGVANLLYYYAPRRHRSLILENLREVAALEKSRAVHWSLERAIKELSE
jgi:HEAT repeat protein